MRCSIVSVVLLSVLMAGCLSPGMQTHYQVPGVDGPGPGVLGMMMHPGMPPTMPPAGMPHPGMAPAMQPVSGMPSANAMPTGQPGQIQQVSGMMPSAMPPRSAMHAPPVSRIPTSQINFRGVEGLVIHFHAQVPGSFDSAPLIAPATHDFGQGAIFQLRLSNIPGWHGRELFPTLEVAPTAARTHAFLQHSSIPIEFTDNDFDQVFHGNFVTKVIYLPNPEFQGLAMSGVGTLVHTTLQPGVDPIVEASQRGSILAVVRMGNIDLSSRQQQGAAGPGPMMGGGGWQPNMPGMGGMGIPQVPVSGVNIPSIGPAMTRTTIGVPGPPQLPQGMHHGPSRASVLRAEPIPAPPSVPTFALPGQPIPNPYVPPHMMMGPPSPPPMSR